MFLTHSTPTRPSARARAPSHQPTNTSRRAASTPSTEHLHDGWLLIICPNNSSVMQQCAASSEQRYYLISICEMKGF